MIKTFAVIGVGVFATAIIAQNSFKTDDTVLIPSETYLEIDESASSLGEVGWEKIQGSIKVGNSTFQPIKIDEIRVSCRCTSMMLDDMVISRQQSTELHYELDTTGNDGHFETRYTLLFTPENEEQQAIVGLLTAYVQPPYRWSAPELLFFKDEPATLTVQLEKIDNWDVSIISVVTPHPAFRAEYDPSSSKGITVSFEPDLWGAMPGKVRLHVTTDHPVNPKTSIPLRVALKKKQGASNSETEQDCCSL